MNEAQAERLLKILERIAKALESSNPAVVYPVYPHSPAVPSTAAAPRGYTCSLCGRHVPNNGSHSCTGGGGFIYTINVDGSAGGNGAVSG